MVALVQHDHHGVGRPALLWGMRGAVLALVLLSGWWLHTQVKQVGQGPAMQRVRLLSPQSEAPPLQPDKPEPQPDDKLDKTQIDPNQPFDASAPAAPGEPGALGVDSEGDAGGDNFGLAAKPGGRELTTYPEGSGYGLGQGAGGSSTGSRAANRLNGAFVGLYLRRLGNRLETQLARQDALRRRAWHVDVALTLDKAGVIRAVRIFDRLDPKLETNLHDALLGMDTGEEALHPGEAIKVSIKSKMEAAAR